MTKSTPMGSLDWPFNPLSVAIGAEADFVARAIDTDRKHLTEVLRAAAAHRGAAFVEIYQNCNIFNDGAFELRGARTREIGSTSSTASRSASAPTGRGLRPLPAILRGRHRAPGATPRWLSTTRTHAPSHRVRAVAAADPDTRHEPARGVP